MIEVSGIRKEYEGVAAVDCLDLTIEEGSFFGLLGPNGAGKTTTLKMMSMLLNPTKGRLPYIINP